MRSRHLIAALVVLAVACLDVTAVRPGAEVRRSGYVRTDIERVEGEIRLEYQAVRQDDDEATPSPAPDDDDDEATPSPAPDDDDDEATPSPAPDDDDDEATPSPAPDDDDDEATPSPAPDDDDDDDGEATPSPIPGDDDDNDEDPPKRRGRLVFLALLLILVVPLIVYIIFRQCSPQNRAVTTYDGM